MVGDRTPVYQQDTSLFSFSLKENRMIHSRGKGGRRCAICKGLKSVVHPFNKGRERASVFFLNLGKEGFPSSEF